MAALQAFLPSGEGIAVDFSGAENGASVRALVAAAVHAPAFAVELLQGDHEVEGAVSISDLEAGGELVVVINAEKQEMVNRAEAILTGLDEQRVALQNASRQMVELGREVGFSRRWFSRGCPQEECIEQICRIEMALQTNTFSREEEAWCLEKIQQLKRSVPKISQHRQLQSQLAMSKYESRSAIQVLMSEELPQVAATAATRERQQLILDELRGRLDQIDYRLEEWFEFAEKELPDEIDDRLEEWIRHYSYYRSDNYSDYDGMNDDGLRDRWAAERDNLKASCRAAHEASGQRRNRRTPGRAVAGRPRGGRFKALERDPVDVKEREC